MPLPIVALKLIVIAVALKDEISPVTAVLLSEMVQIGTIPHVLAKVMVQAVVIPEPIVMDPSLSSPVLLGLEPQDETEGVGPAVIK